MRGKGLLSGGDQGDLGGVPGPQASQTSASCPLAAMHPGHRLPPTGCPGTGQGSCNTSKLPSDPEAPVRRGFRALRQLLESLRTLYAESCQHQGPPYIPPSQRRDPEFCSWCVDQDKGIL